MKSVQIEQLIQNLKVNGYDKEVTLKELKRELVPFVGCDKYKLKYQIEALCDCGYFEPVSPSVLKIIGV